VHGTKTIADVKRSDNRGVLGCLYGRVPEVTYPMGVSLFLDILYAIFCLRRRKANSRLPIGCRSRRRSGEGTILRLSSALKGGCQRGRYSEEVTVPTVEDSGKWTIA
jgi:hypothetical protein